VIVDPDRAELECPRRPERAPDVARPDRCREPVAGVVRPGDRLGVVGEALDGDDGPEYLALDDPSRCETTATTVGETK
jgi:hypothetical protein